MKLRTLFGVAAALAACAVHAGDIYRWVDENGRTQMSDRVPEQYRATARRLGDSRQYELTPQQRNEAQARAAREKAREDADARARADAEARAAAAAGAASQPATPSKAAAKEDVEPNTISAAECDAWWREYLNNSACYAPFRTARGGMKAGAFEACGDPVLNPSRQCARYK